MKSKEDRNLTFTCYKLRFFFSIYPRAYMKRDNGNEVNIELYIYIYIHQS